MNQPRPAELAGQIALVTGGARRVGAQIARTLHAAGANVAIHCHRSLEDAQRAGGRTGQARGTAAPACCDADLLRPQRRCRALVAGACERFGGLNLLVNNASTFYPTPLGTITPAQWEDLIGTNLQAPLFLAQAAAAPLRASRGAVINIVDIHGMRPLRDHTVYSVAKAGLIMLTRALARELAPEVRVNGIAPGAVLWPENGIDEQRRQQILEQTAAAPPRLAGRHRAHGAVLCGRRAIRDRTDPRGRRRPQHRLVTAGTGGSRRIQIRFGGGHEVLGLRKLGPQRADGAPCHRMQHLRREFGQRPEHVGRRSRSRRGSV